MSRNGNRPVTTDQHKHVVDELVGLHAVSPLDDADKLRLADALIIAFEGYELVERREPSMRIRIVARYDSQCAQCGDRIGAGSTILFDTGSRKATHLDCQSPEAA